MRNKPTRARQIAIALVLGLMVFVFDSATLAHADSNCDSTARQTYETLATDFVSHFSGDPYSFNPEHLTAEDFCQIQRLTHLSSIIEGDLINDIASYNLHIQYLAKFKADQKSDELPPSVESMLVSFQETWFRVEMNLLLTQEFERSHRVSKLAGLGVLVVASAIAIVPGMRKYSTRPLKVIRSLFRFLLQRRPFLASSASLFQAEKQNRKEKKKEATVLTAPPAFHPDLGLSNYDPRTEDVYTRDFEHNMLSVIGGVSIGSVAGNMVDHIYKAPKWEAWFPKLPYINHGIPRFFSPGMLIKITVTLVATDLSSRSLDYIEKRVTYDSYYNELHGIIVQMQQAVANKNLYQIWYYGQRLQNDMALARLMLVKDFLAEREDLNGIYKKRLCANDTTMTADLYKSLNAKYVGEFTTKVSAYHHELAEAHALTGYAETEMLKLKTEVLKTFIEDMNTSFTLESRVLHKTEDAANEYWDMANADIADYGCTEQPAQATP